MTHCFVSQTLWQGVILGLNSHTAVLLRRTESRVSTWSVVNLLQQVFLGFLPSSSERGSSLKLVMSSSRDSIPCFLDRGVAATAAGEWFCKEPFVVKTIVSTMASRHLPDSHVTKMAEEVTRCLESVRHGIHKTAS